MDADPAGGGAEDVGREGMLRVEVRLLKLAFQKDHKRKAFFLIQRDKKILRLIGAVNPRQMTQGDARCGHRADDNIRASK